MTLLWRDRDNQLMRHHGAGGGCWGFVGLRLYLFGTAFPFYIFFFFTFGTFFSFCEELWYTKCQINEKARKSHHAGKACFASVGLGIMGSELASMLTCLNLHVILKVALRLLMEVKSLGSYDQWEWADTAGWFTQETGLMVEANGCVFLLYVTFDFRALGASTSPEKTRRNPRRSIKVSSLRAFQNHQE